jgi:LacI family transcriptional regulator
MSSKKEPNRNPTQFDVALRAGVSQATVSHILNKSTAITIPEETRNRVLNVMKDIGYVPSRAARSLRTNKTCTIAAIIPDITNPFYPLLIRGIQDITKVNDYDLIIYNSDGDEDEERKCLFSIRENQVDGLIVVPFHITNKDLLEIGIPVVQIVQKPRCEPVLDSLYIDNAKAAYEVVNHLIETGHNRIGMLAGAKDTPPRGDRIRGYKRALAHHKLPQEEILIRGADWSEEEGYQAMLELLKVNPKIDAFFTANDLLATGAILAIKEAGLKIPQDIAVAGFDDNPSSRLITPSLTSINQHQQNIGRRSAEILFSRINSDSLTKIISEEMPFSLVIRESA